MQRQLFSQQFYHLFLIDISESGNTLRKVHLATGFAEPYELTILFMDICEAAGTAADISMLSCRIAEDECMWRNIACHH